MFEHVDGYCERIAPGFWDEPLNAVTNLSFIIAALILWRLAKREGTALRPSFLIPTALLFLTGVGSFLFHTFANGWTGIADVAALALCLLATICFTAYRFLGMGPFVLLITTGFGGYHLHYLAHRGGGAADPISLGLWLLGLCLLVTVIFTARRSLGMGWLSALIWPAAMIGGAVLFGRLAPIPGSFYFVPLAAGIGISALLLIRGHPAWRWVAAAVIVFLPSFFFRTIDGAVCESFPYGTHFLWHILNGVVLGLAIRPLAWGDEGGHRDGAGRAAG